MSETIEITASLRIERPVDEVRAHNNVHPGIRYEWEPAVPPDGNRV